LVAEKMQENIYMREKKGLHFNFDIEGIEKTRDCYGVVGVVVDVRYQFGIADIKSLKSHVNKRKIQFPQYLKLEHTGFLRSSKHTTLQQVRKKSRNQNKRRETHQNKKKLDPAPTPTSTAGPTKYPPPPTLNPNGEGALYDTE
jgi:hypothetical protein